jgi:hypothetical protein
MLCNNDSCVNYQCKIKYSGAIKLAEISKQRQTEEAVDLRDEICGYKLFEGDENGNDKCKKQNARD